MQRSGIVGNKEPVDAFHGVLFVTVHCLLGEPLPMGHSFVVLTHVAPWSAEPSGRDVLDGSSVGAIEKLDVVARRFLARVDANDAYALSRHKVPQAIDQLVSLVHGS